MILNRLALYEKVSVVGDVLHVVRTRNQGIAFGLLNDSTGVWRTPVLLVAGVAILIWLVRLERSVGDARTRLGIALIAGGAVGNLGDRLMNGGVTDFILFTGFPYIFNVADAAIVVGALLLAAGLVIVEREDEDGGGPMTQPG
jgi:signal peptidase II